MPLCFFSWVTRAETCASHVVDASQPVTLLVHVVCFSRALTQLCKEEGAEKEEGEEVGRKGIQIPREKEPGKAGEASGRRDPGLLPPAHSGDSIACSPQERLVLALSLGPCSELPSVVPRPRGSLPWEGSPLCRPVTQAGIVAG